MPIFKNCIQSHLTNKPRHCVLIGGGDIARRLIPLLLPRYTVWIASRFGADNPAQKWRQMGVRTITIDLDQPHTLARLRGLAPFFIVLAPPKPIEAITHHDDQNQNADCIGLRARKTISHTGLETRMRALVAYLPKGGRGVYVSTTGVYGDKDGEFIDETARLNPQTARAQARVAAENVMRMWARRSQATIAIVRVPGIYAPDRPKKIPRLVLNPEQDVYTNHIHADDLARILVCALTRGAPNRVYHAVDDSHITHGQYANYLAHKHGASPPLVVMRAQLQLELSPMQYSFLRESRRLANTRMKNELGVRLNWPTVID